MNNRSKALRGVFLAAFVSLLVFASARLTLLGVGWWIDDGDQPVKSDIIVILAGDISRELLGAELYAQGFAPDVWISRARPDSSIAELAKFGIPMPSEEAIDRQILVKRGVPNDRIRVYGSDVVSTADEAEALRREFPSRGKRILVVTSRYHVRRARIVFRRLLREADVRVVAEPYDDSRKPWWKDKELAENAPLEIMKTLYYLTGGRMK